MCAGAECGSLPSAWNLYVSAHPGIDALPSDPHALAALSAALRELVKGGLGRAAGTHIAASGTADLRDRLMPNFAFSLEGGKGGLEEGLRALCAAIERQREWIELVGKTVGEEKVIRVHYTRAVTAAMARALPVDIAGILRDFYESMLADFTPEEGEDDEMDYSDHELEGGGGGDDEVIECVTSRALRDLGMSPLVEEACSSVLSTALEEYVKRIATGCFDEPALAKANAWLRKGPFRFIRRVLPSSNYREQSSRLEFHVLEALGELRISELFDIVVDFPESKPAVEDLRTCLKSTGRTRWLVSSFCSAIRKRLLHPGATTSTILQLYVAVIKVMRELDSTGVLLDAVGTPIQAYLRDRSDAIRCIVTMLTECGEGNSLLEELSAEEPTAARDLIVDAETSENFAAAMRWEPDPMDASPTGPLLSREGDIVSMLVGIYGSKELFVNEYRALLAEKLLSRGAERDTDREIRALELLKLRFGEQSMHNCEVMLRDMADSKRVNTNVAHERSKVGQDSGIGPLSTTIISHLFWPQLTGEGLQLPARVKEWLDTFASRYHQLKDPRKLEWRPHLGLVQLDLCFDDGRETTFSVSPPLAAIVLRFEEKSVWRMSDLATTLGITVESLRRRAAYWIGHGVLKEEQEGNETVLRAVESAAEAAEAAAGGAAAADDGDAAVADTTEQDNAVYEGYIVGMLTNFKSLPLERIHNMLKMFMPEYDRTERQLASILGGLCAAEKLTQDSGEYSRRS